MMKGEKKGRRKSPSPERKLSLEKMKKSEQVDMRDLRTQFKDMVEEVYSKKRN